MVLRLSQHWRPVYTYTLNEKAIQFNCLRSTILIYYLKIVDILAMARQAR